MSTEHSGCFLGSPAGGRFLNIFDALTPKEEGWYTYILKGGPGTGKSTLMKDLALRMEKQDIGVERIFCASDPDSLDAVIFPQLRACVADGTAPHVLEPDYPGVQGEIVNLGHWNGEKLLQNREKIIALTDENRALHTKSRGYLEVCFSMYAKASALECTCLDREKIKRFALRQCAKSFPAQTREQGRETLRLLEAVTPKGFWFAEEYARSFCTNGIVIHDDFGGAAQGVLALVRREAKERGMDVITSPSLFGKGIRHLILPQIHFGIFTYDHLCTVDIPGAKHIHFNRFTDRSTYRLYRERLNFTRKASWDLLDAACSALQTAGEVHNKLEKLYGEAMDYTAVERTAQLLFEKLWQRNWNEEGE